jgi:hypothetical protein
MNEIDYFKLFVLYSGDVAANVDHLHVNRIYLVGFSYIVIKDYHTTQITMRLQNYCNCKSMT